MKRAGALFFVGLLAIGCGGTSTPGPGNRVVIGAVIDRTGNNASPTWPDALKLAESLVNDGLVRGGITSYHFEVVIQDSLNNPATALARAQSLVRDQGAKAIITDSSQNDTALNLTFYNSDTNDDLGVPLQCGGCTSGSINSMTGSTADLRNEKGFNFRSIMATKLEALVLLRELLSQGNMGDINGDGVFKISIYASNESFAKATAKDLYTYLNPAPPAVALRATPPCSLTLLTGCTDVETIFVPASVNANTYNWNADLVKLTDNSNDCFGDCSAATPLKLTNDGAPDFIIVVGFAEHYIPFVENYKLNHYTIPVYHFHNFRNITVITALGSLAEGEKGISHVIVDPKDSPMVNLMQSRYGHPLAYRDTTFFDAAVTFMLAAIWAAHGGNPNDVRPEDLRDALKTMPSAMPSSSAIEDTTSNRYGPEAIADAVNVLKSGTTTINYEGASGKMDYDSLHNVKQKLVLWHVSDGVFIDEQTFDCTQTDCPPITP